MNNARYKPSVDAKNRNDINKINKTPRPILIKTAQYYKDDIENRRQMSKDYYWANKEKQCQNKRDWYAWHKSWGGRYENDLLKIHADIFD